MTLHEMANNLLKDALSLRSSLIPFSRGTKTTDCYMSCFAILFYWQFATEWTKLRWQMAENGTA